MRPRAHTLIAFLFLGAVLNVLIAWTCEVTTSTVCVDLTDQAARTRRPFSVEGIWTSSNTVQEARGLGRATIWYLRGLGGGDVCVHQAGWPMLSMQFQYDESAAAPWPASPAGTYRAAINTAPGAGIPRRLSAKPLPMRPIPLGFAVDTLLWGLVLFLPFGGTVEFVRRRRRAAKGLCPACAYPTGVSAVCTECGRAVPSRRA